MIPEIQLLNRLAPPKALVLWNSPSAWLWRKKLSQLAQRAGFTNYDDLKQAHGSRWAWTLQKKVLSEELNAYPTAAIAQADGQNDLPEGSTDIQITSPGKKSDYWEDHIGEFVETMNKEMSLARLKQDREGFAPES
jgi:hypothetical protein